MKRLVIITGASRGIGEAIAEEFNDLFPNETHLLLIARDFNKLAEVRNKLIKKTNNKNQVTILDLDFSIPHQVSDYFKLLKEVFVDTNLSSFGELYVIFNHGTLEYGSISLKAQEPLRKNFETNLFSVWHMLSAINLLIPTSVIEKQFHVNISSKYAEEPVAQWSGQCCARSSREMLFKCLALEQPNLRCLNYIPGIVNTDMLRQAYDLNPEHYKNIYSDRNYIEPRDTAKQLLSILIENKFSSGKTEQFNK